MPFLAPVALLLALGTPAQPGALPQAGSSQGVVATLKVGGEGGWDYVALDPGTRRLFVPRGTHTMVLDLDGKVLGDIPDTLGVHGVALAPELDRGFTSNGRANTVTVFRLSTLAVEKVVRTTGENPDSILFDPATKRVFTFNGRGANATVLDAATQEVAGTIPVGGKPEFCVADGKGTVYANVEDTSELLAIDAATLKVLHRWSLKPLEEPSGLAMDREAGRLFSVGANRLMAVVDASSGKVLQTLPIGEGCDAAAFDPGIRTAYASNGEGTLTVVRRAPGGGYQVAATVPTKRSARTMAVDPTSHRIYLPAAEFGPVPEARPGQRVRPPMIPGSFRILVVGTEGSPAR
jgi:DNA-binding beta-propeller fold protein YncE